MSLPPFNFFFPIACCQGAVWTLSVFQIGFALPDRRSDLHAPKHSPRLCILDHLCTRLYCSLGSSRTIAAVSPCFLRERRPVAPVFERRNRKGIGGPIFTVEIERPWKRGRPRSIFGEQCLRHGRDSQNFCGSGSRRKTFRSSLRLACFP
jgi:hypothetical protein